MRIIILLWNYKRLKTLQLVPPKLLINWLKLRKKLRKHKKIELPVVESRLFIKIIFLEKFVPYFSLLFNKLLRWLSLIFCRFTFNWKYVRVLKYVYKLFCYLFFYSYSFEKMCSI